MQRILIASPLLVLASVLAACAPRAKSLEDYRMPTEEPAPASLTEVAASAIPPADCPVTTTGILSFEAPEPFSPAAPWDRFFWFGSEQLWTALPEDGVWSGLPKTPDGYTQKIMWWSVLYSLPDEPKPALTVSGHRLDGDAPPLRFYGATNAMADDIGKAMLTGVEFPTPGCWRVIGEYKGAELIFIVWAAP
jgi:hypothetical protein